MADIPWMNEDGSFAEDWHGAALGEELSTNPSLRDFKDIRGLAKAFVDTKQALGGRVAIPTDAEHQKDFFRKHLGGVEKPEDYEIGKPADWPEDVPFNEGLVNTFLAAAAEAGAPKGLVQAIAARTIEADKQAALEAQKKANDARADYATKSEATLKETWGDKFDTELERARRGFISKYVPDALKQKIAQRLGVETLTEEHVTKALKSDAALAQICHSLGTLTADDTSTSGGAPGGKATEEVVPYHKTRPHLYASRPKDDPERMWYTNHGFDWDTMTWRTGEPK